MFAHFVHTLRCAFLRLRQQKSSICLFHCRTDQSLVHADSDSYHDGGYRPSSLPWQYRDTSMISKLRTLAAIIL